MRASLLFVALTAATVLSVDMMAGAAKAGVVCGITGCYAPQVRPVRQRKPQTLGRPANQPLGQPLGQTLSRPLGHS